MNDPKASYKGTEPNPKGLGYCAHTEKVGASNRWALALSRTLKEGISKPKGKSYLIHHNGGRPFEVTVKTPPSPVGGWVAATKHTRASSKKEVYVYRREKYDGRKYSYEEYNVLPYTIFVCKFKANKVYIGKDPSMGKFALGNSILLDLGGKKYTCISPTIFEFSIEPDDEFVKFSSFLVGTDNPDPILLGKKNFYSLVDLTYASRSYFPKDWKLDEEAHSFYYGKWDKKKKVHVTEVKEKKKLRGFKRLA